MKKYMAQEQFDYCVCFAALSSLVTEHDESELIEMVWQEYERYILDDYIQFKIDVLYATVQAKRMLSDLDVSSHPSFLKAFQHYIENYNLDGTKKSSLKRFLSGALFSKSEQNPDRVQDFKKRMSLFYFKIISGAYNP
ncbi:MAG: hypothetical protein KKF30_09860 [Proteobacteria bacterium]|nr:hypothetical protein [Pseudomonadota bacterium]MBU4468847.1 hypothetical protein [Pseudomonadota bacterium]MCG2750840.1 hypothetical protein [Desulfobacteraceae bacterium]